MYSIFHPLDVNERLPRELVLEGRRHARFDWQLMLTLVGALYLPALMLMVVVLGSFNVSGLVAFGVAGVALIGVFLYVISAARDR
jgi:lipopolysaccharide export LptBFGC system permease protein LptF